MCRLSMIPVLVTLCVSVCSSAGAQPIVVLIGGNHSDPSPGQLAGTSGRGGNSGLWRLKEDLRTAEAIPAEYFNWNGTRAGEIDAPEPGGARAIEREIRRMKAERPEAPIILIGNSWGGHTAWQVCHLLAGGSLHEELGSQRSIGVTPTESSVLEPGKPPSASAGETLSADPQSPGDANHPDDAEQSANKPVLAVRLVVFLDPSSFGRGKEPRPTTLPDNVARAVTYYTHNSFGWREWPREPRIENIDLGDPTHGFQYPGGPKYDSVLNWKAHVSAEWDERIHASIRARIVAAIAPAVAPQNAP